MIARWLTLAVVQYLTRLQLCLILDLMVLPWFVPKTGGQTCVASWRWEICVWGKPPFVLLISCGSSLPFLPLTEKNGMLTFMPYYWQKAWVAEGGRRCEQGVLHLQPNATLRQDETGIENRFHYVNLGVRFLEPQVGLRHGTSEKSGIPHLRENLSISST